MILLRRYVFSNIFHIYFFCMWKILFIFVVVRYFCTCKEKIFYNFVFLTNFYEYKWLFMWFYLVLIHLFIFFFFLKRFLKKMRYEDLLQWWYFAVCPNDDDTVCIGSEEVNDKKKRKMFTASNLLLWDYFIIMRACATCVAGSMAITKLFSSILFLLSLFSVMRCLFV